MGLPEKKDLAGPRVIQLWQEVIEQRRTNSNFFLPGAAEEYNAGRYSAKTILKTLEDDWWYFILDPGFPITEMAQIFGDDSEKPPCRDKLNNGWMLDGNSPWTKESQKPGYYLVSMPLLRDLGLNQQETAIKDLAGDKIGRASCRLAIVLGISYFLAFGDYGFGGCHHLGPEMNDSGSAKTNCVVAFSPKGFALYNFSKGGPSHKDIGVCLVRKFDP